MKTLRPLATIALLIVTQSVLAEPAAPITTPLDQLGASAQTQAGRDWFEQQQRIAAELRAEDMLARLHAAELDAELEPCINGGVSPSGTFATAELEAIANALADPRVQALLTDSAYYAAVVEGAGRLHDWDESVE